jgi:predicted ATP-grasp superfamily ATP-dependent carboligase
LSLSAVFVGTLGGSRLVGVTRQFLGIAGEPFVYRGSIGPWPLQPTERLRLAELGKAIGSAFSLVGLFGVDFNLLDGEPWLIEINPRYTASVEVLELALGRSLLAEHVSACRGIAVESRAPESKSDRFVGKRVLYAGRELVIKDLFPVEPPTGGNLYDVPELADIPAVGSTFSVGEPVVTVFARGMTLEACVQALDTAEERWSARLRIGPNSRDIGLPDALALIPG